MSRLRTAAATDTGYLRTVNQDLALAGNDLAAVADGMGGHLGGEVAARVAVEQLLDAYRRDRTPDGLIAAVRAANDAVYRRSRSDRSVRGMGTTLTAAALVGEGPGEPEGQVRIALVNVGDSRAYLVDWQERRILQLTEDHSVVEEMVRSGELTPEEASVHPHRHVLTRALGIEAGIEPDCWELDLDSGSRLLLCSDGLTNELDEQEIAEVLLDEADLDKAANQLVKLALRRGGTDNITVVVLDVVAGESAADGDEVIVIPAAVPGAPGLASPAGTLEITEAIAVTPSASVGAAPPPAVGDQPAVRTGTSPIARSTAPLGTPAVAAGEAPRTPHSRPMVLVPKAKRKKVQRDRIVTVRVVLFVLIFAAVLGGTGGVVIWFNQASFFVGLNQGHVTIFQGRPGGMLWFKPSIVERTSLTPSDLLASNLVYLHQGMEESSYQAARQLVRDLSLERSRLRQSESTTTTTAPVTTTTLASGIAPTTTGTAGPTTTSSTTSTSTSTTTTTLATTTTTTLATTTTTRPK